MDKEEIRQMITEYVSELIGDTPLAYQLDAAITEHWHPQYALREEVDELKKEVQRLSDLVGDTPVAEQLCVALNG